MRVPPLVLPWFGWPDPDLPVTFPGGNRSQVRIRSIPNPLNFDIRCLSVREWLSDHAYIRLAAVRVWNFALDMIGFRGRLYFIWSVLLSFVHRFISNCFQLHREPGLQLVSTTKLAPSGGSHLFWFTIRNCEVALIKDRKVDERFSSPIPFEIAL